MAWAWPLPRRFWGLPDRWLWACSNSSPGTGKNRFYRELEEWMSTITRVGFSAGDGDGSPEQNMMAHVVDHMGEQMESLQMMLTQSDISRAAVDEKLGLLADSVHRLSEKTRKWRRE